MMLPLYHRRSSFTKYDYFNISQLHFLFFPFLALSLPPQQPAQRQPKQQLGPPNSTPATHPEQNQLKPTVIAPKSQKPLPPIPQHTSKSTTLLSDTTGTIL